MSTSAPAPPRSDPDPTTGAPKPKIVRRLQAQRAKQRSRSKLVRGLTVLAGFLVVALGVVALPFPGPGWLIIFVGLAILSLEFSWAGRALDWLLVAVAQMQKRFQAAPRGQKIALGVVVLLALAALAAWAWFGDIPLLPV